MLSDPLGLKPPGTCPPWLKCNPGNPYTMPPEFPPPTTPPILNLDCFRKCIEENRWDWGWFTLYTVGNPAVNKGVGGTGRVGAGGLPPHPTSWQHKVGSYCTRVTGNPWFGRLGKLVGRASLVPTVWEGCYDWGTILRCSLVCVECPGQKK